jgi:hypothetical protein
VAPHAGQEIHVVLDNLSTQTTPDVRAWLEANPNVHFHFTPTGPDIDQFVGIAAGDELDVDDSVPCVGRAEHSDAGAVSKQHSGAQIAASLGHRGVIGQ